MNLVIYVITSLYTQWNISYKSGSVLNNHDIFQNKYTDIFILNEILLAQSKIIFEKKTRSKSIRIYILIFIFNKFFVFN